LPIVNKPPEPATPRLPNLRDKGWSVARQPTRKTVSVLTPARRTSLGEDVADRLRQAILLGELTPGQHLREEELADLLDVSRGPVRDAFVLLEREGLIRSSRRRGVTVVELTREDLYEIYTLRSALEPLATTLAISRGTPADVAEVEASLAEMVAAISGSRKLTERDAADLDVSFHDAIYRAAHHDRLYAAWSQIRLPTYRFMLSRNVANPDWREGTVRGHTGILRAITDGDEDAAVATIKEHISFAYDRILQSYLDESDEATTQRLPR
jgi:DNA-binding GntR family transcriptional regulator